MRSFPRYPRADCVQRKFAHMPGPMFSEKPQANRLGPLAALDHVHGHALPFRKIGHAAPGECRGMHENVLAAAVPDDETEYPFLGVSFFPSPLLSRGAVGGVLCLG